MKYINVKAFEAALLSFKNREPFDHCIIDDFFLPNVAEQLEADFLDYEDLKWFYYKNAIEDKKALNDWNQFPSLTYKVFTELMSEDFVKIISRQLGVDIYVDHGLHGGGWHIHGPGGNLNPHLDYSIHPKHGFLRKINIIIYVSSLLLPEHGGHLGLWDHAVDKNGPGALISEIQPKFNRAVVFDTTQNSWHGMSRALVQPDGIYRKSLAIYYLIEPMEGVDPRERALFAPRENQKNDENIKELIRVRADAKMFAQAYKNNKS